MTIKLEEGMMVYCPIFGTGTYKVVQDKEDKHNFKLQNKYGDAPFTMVFGINGSTIKQDVKNISFVLENPVVFEVNEKNREALSELYNLEFEQQTFNDDIYLLVRKHGCVVCSVSDDSLDDCDTLNVIVGIVDVCDEFVYDCNGQTYKYAKPIKGFKPISKVSTKTMSLTELKNIVRG